MPYLKIQLNRPVEPEAARSLLAKASADLARELGKPESYVMAELTNNPHMIFGGTDAPAAYLELKSIGLPAGSHKALSRSLAVLLEQGAGIPPARVYIEFTDVKGNSWGWNGGTF